MANIFEKVTNTLNREFFRVNDNETTTPMKVVLENTSYIPEAVEVYSFNLAAGTVKARTLNLYYSKTDSVKFVSQYLRYWYYFERAAIVAEYGKFAEATPETEADKYIMECIRERYDNAMDALARFDNVRGVSETVSLLVVADRKMKEEAYPVRIRSAFAPVNKVLREINNSDAEEKAVNLKPLRDALKDLCKAVWIPTEDGTVAKYVYNANARLTEEVFRVSMRGRERTKSGKIASKYAKASELMREVVYACYQELQRKDKELNVDLSTPADAPASNEPTNA